MNVIEFHEAANIFPLDEASIPDLAKDIRANGQQMPIERLGGKIIDGRRRFKACELAGVQPKFKDVNVADPVAYVLSLNLYRRHLTPSQLSMVGARATQLTEKLAAEAKERMKAGKRNPVESLPQGQTGKTRDKIGEAVGVSGKSIDHATRVLNNAIPEVVKAVDEGRMAVSTAALLSTEPEEVQREEAASPKRNRTYESVSKPRHDPEVEVSEETTEEAPIKSRGKGVALAHEAISCLTRIPKNDALRSRGFQIVTDWIRRNK